MDQGRDTRYIVNAMDLFLSYFLGVPKLVNFVTVALDTAAGEEGDIATDKLSFLRTVGSGFAPLIFKLPQNTSYKTLQELCKTVWETLEEAPNLSEMMVG